MRRHGLDALIVVAAIEGAVEVALRDGPEAPTITPWFAVPAILLMVLPLLARRRLPFAAPALVWILGAALSFIDGRFVTLSASTFAAGMAAALLLGHQREERQARIGLAITLGCSVIVVYNDPSHDTGSLVFSPVLFAICWLAGFALREHGERADAAEVRAARAERERETAARLAVAEERARIARELHDVVAHAVSVMVLQVGAVRHGMPAELGESKDALEGVERTGRSAMAEMRLLLGAMRDGDEPAERAPQPGLDGLEALAEQVRRAGLPVEVRAEGEPVAAPAPDRPVRLPRGAGGAHQRAQARRRRPRRRARALRARSPARRGARRRRRHVGLRRPRPRADRPARACAHLRRRDVRRPRAGRRLPAEHAAPIAGGGS